MGQDWRGDPADGDDDVVEQRGQTFPRLSWRPPRGPVLLAAGLLAGLVIGLAGGYAAGHRQTAGPRAPSGTSAVPGTLEQTDFPVLAQPGPECAAQMGDKLQLGVDVTNQSGARVTLRHVNVVLPLGGLKPVTQQWAPCGILADDQAVPGAQLPPGASGWFTVTFKVRVKCPQPLPVQFTVSYIHNGRTASAGLPGFADLSHVPYSGCPARSLRTHAMPLKLRGQGCP